MIDIKNPKNIYESLSSSILSITDKLKIKTDDEKFEASKVEVLNLMDTFRQEKLDKAIDELKNSQEWEKFTVAFYGETNAGKSTIIESLRIYFQEEEKSLYLSIHIRPIQIDLSSMFVHLVADILDRGLKHSVRRWIGDHYRC